MPWRRGIRRPIVVAATGQDKLLPGTNITVRGAVIPSTGGDYATIVIKHLEEIRSFPLGNQFFIALTALGSRQIIVYGGEGSNQAAGSAGGYKKLVKFAEKYINGDKDLFKDELELTLRKSGLNTRTFANRLKAMKLNNWAGGTTTNPFILKQDLASEVDSWLEGKSVPKRGDELDVVVLALSQWLENGNGCSTRINYDPHKTTTASGPRPPHAALMHELMHAYYNAMGGQMGVEESSDQKNGGRLFELQACGLKPFNTAEFSENKFRSELGVGLRASYP